MLLAKGSCHMIMSHVAAPDPSLSGEWEPRVHAGLKTWDPPVGGSNTIQRGMGPFYGGLDGTRGGTGLNHHRWGPDDICGGPDPNVVVQIHGSSS